MMPPRTIQEAMYEAAQALHGISPLNRALCAILGWISPRALARLDTDALDELIALFDGLRDLAGFPPDAHVIVSLVNRIDPARLSPAARERGIDLRHWASTWRSCTIEPDPWEHAGWASVEAGSR